MFALACASFRSSHWLLRTLLRIVTTPVTRVFFRDFYLADQVRRAARARRATHRAERRRVNQLSSLAISLMDFEFFICYYTNDALTATNTCLG